MAIRYGKIAEIEDKVIESAENLNLLSDLIKIGEMTKVFQTKKSVYAIICSVLGKYIEQGLIFREHFLELFYAYHKGDQDKIDALLKDYKYLVCEKFVIFTLFLLEGVSSSKRFLMDPNKVLVFFKTLFGIAKVLNLQIVGDESEGELDKYYLSLILNKFILLKTYSPLLIELITDNYLFGYPDLVLFSIDYLQEVVKHNPSENVMKNVLTIVTNFEMTIEEIYNSGFFFNSSSNFADLPTFEFMFKKKCESLWFNILKYDKLTVAQKRHILKKLQERVFPYILHPLMFADFVLEMASTEVLDNTLMEIQIFALSCILFLSQTCSYEYSSFYIKLYALADVDKSGNSPFDMPEQVSLAYVKLLELSLKSTSVPHALVCAFIKKLARLSIKASLTSTITSLGIILNLIKRHPKTMELIHKTRKEPKQLGDPYKEGVRDPMDSDAAKSSLWELNYLKLHYNPLVRELVKVFETKFTAEESMNMEELSKIGYLLTAKKEEARAISKLDANIEKLYRSPSKKVKVCDGLLDSLEN